MSHLWHHALDYETSHVTAESIFSHCKTGMKQDY